MKRIQNILLLVLLALNGYSFGQEKSGWENDYLIGKVKTFEEYDYNFDISDSINHDDFMSRFYQCGFDVDKMLRFADSIMTESDTKYSTSKEYDSLGYYTKLHDMFLANKYDDSGRILWRIILENNLPKDTVFFKYDEAGRLIKRKYQNRMHEWEFDLEGHLVKELYKDVEMDSVLIHKKYEYDKNGILHRSESFGNREYLGCSKGYYEYDSRGNVVFEREYGWGLYVPLMEKKTKYKYDRNDSIIKQTCLKVKWADEPIVKDTIWQVTDSDGQVVSQSGYTWTFQKTKRKSKSVKTISRNAKGIMTEEILMTFEKGERNPGSITKKRYDELGRMIEEEHIGDSYPPPYKKICRYYKDTDNWSYFAGFIGENFEFDHESLFFFDEKGNCIAHIQWMPDSPSREYYFMVYKIGYYE